MAGPGSRLAANAALCGATVVVLVIVVAHFGRELGAVGRAGVAVAAVGVAMMLAGTVVAAIGASARGPAAVVGGDAAPRLVAYEGVMLTEAEVAAVRAVRGRLLPMAQLPATTADVPRLPYRPRVYSFERRRPRHYGQRKLLLSEVDFLARVARRGDTALYVGSASGIHIPFLAALFPEVHFTLYDPREFDLRGAASGLDRAEIARRIEAHREFFTDETARRYAGRDDVLFISDIRTGTEGETVPTDAMVEQDMRWQEEWVRIIDPRAALLKYRLNYTRAGAGETRYLAGDVRLQVWPGGTSTETRLEARRPYAQAVVSARDHEERMFYINTVLRMWAEYDHGVDVALAPGLDRGFDSASEVRIWRDYLATPWAAAWRRSRRGPKPRGSGGDGVAQLINAASAALHRGLADAPSARWKPAAPPAEN